MLEGQDVVYKGIREFLASREEDSPSDSPDSSPDSPGPGSPPGSSGTGNFFDVYEEWLCSETGEVESGNTDYAEVRLR